MKLYVMHMMGDINLGGRVYSTAKARQLIDDIDACKYHPDAWVDITDMDTNQKMVPVYGDTGTDDCIDYCIGFEPAPDDAQLDLCLEA